MKRETLEPRWPLYGMLVSLAAGIGLGLLIALAIERVLDRANRQPMQVEYTLEPGPTVWR